MTVYWKFLVGNVTVSTEIGICNNANPRVRVELFLKVIA